MVNSALLLRAAELVEREAECLSSSYVVSTMTSDGPVWDDQNAKADHDEMLAIAAELRKGAA